MGASQHWTHRSKVWREKRVECRRDTALLPNAAAEEFPRRESCVAVGKRSKVRVSMLLCTSMGRSDPNFGDSKKAYGREEMPQRERADLFNRKAWIIQEVFAGWLHDWDEKLEAAELHFGIHFYSTFWDQHINHIINRIAKSVNILAKFLFFLLQKHKLKLTMLFISLI